MSDIFKGRSPDSEESQEKSENKDDLESLNLSFNEANLAKSKHGAEQNQDADKTLSKLDLDMAAENSWQPGQVKPFSLKKSEFVKLELEKSFSACKPLINDFLKTTPLESHQELSAAEQKELEKGHYSLANATTNQEALAGALYLARLYQHLRYIEEAKKAAELALGIDPDNDRGKHLFKELERMHPVDLAASAHISPIQLLSKSNLRKRILSLTGGKVIVVGDLLIDELIEGSPERISREAPVLILEHIATELILGGAANAANNLAALGGACHAIGICGQDEYAAKLAQLFAKSQITYDLIEDKSRPTTVKTRVLSKSHSFRQQLLRLDRISHEQVNSLIESKLIDKITAVAGQHQAMVLSDYQAGVVTDDLIRACRSVAHHNKLILAVDAQGDFARFQNVTLITPNQPDVEKALGYSIQSKEELTKAGQELLLLTGAAAVLISRGANGMILFQQNEPTFELPAFNKSKVFDVTGAGDTVVATMALALVTGSNCIEAMALGNLAASIVVKKPGTAVTNQKEMLESLDMLHLAD